MVKNQHLTIRIDSDDQNRIKEIAAELGISRGAVVRIALTMLFDEYAKMKDRFI